MKEEALKLANDLEELHEQDLIDGVAHLSMPQASAMIRKLVEELDKWENPIYKSIPVIKIPQTKPLSDDEIAKLWFKCGDDEYTVRRFARAIEERHKIK